MKRLLFITAFPPCNNSGGESFTLNTIKNLSTDYAIDLIYFKYPNHNCIANEYVRKVESYSPSTTNCLKRPWVPFLFSRRFSKTILHHIADISSNYDIIYFDYSQTAIYSLFIKHPYKIIRIHDVIAQKYCRQRPLLVPWIKWFEKKVLCSAKKVFTFSYKDDNLLKELYNIDSVWTNEYISDECIPLHAQPYKNDKSFLFFGYWGRKENTNGLIWFIKNVFPELSDSVKQVFFVMGGGMPDEILKQYIQPNNINYLGFIEDSHSIIAQHTAMIVPLFEGAGIKVKVLDSFAVGTPVIGTSIAFEGIPTIDGLTFVANDATAFAIAINNINSTFDKSQMQQKFLNAFGRNRINKLI